jgi:hypothetical protein
LLFIININNDITNNKCFGYVIPVDNDNKVSFRFYVGAMVLAIVRTMDYRVYGFILHSTDPNKYKCITDNNYDGLLEIYDDNGIIYTTFNLTKYGNAWILSNYKLIGV